MFHKAGVNVIVMLPNKENPTFARDVADCRDEVESYTDKDAKGWDIQETVSVDVLSASKPCNKLKESQHICEDGGEAVPVPDAKMIELS